MWEKGVEKGRDILRVKGEGRETKGEGSTGRGERF